MPDTSIDKSPITPAVGCENHPPWTSVSFACGGWLQFYMFGVAKALQASGLDYPSSVTYCGCSAGALAAVGLALEGNFDAAVTFCKEKCVPEVSYARRLATETYCILICLTHRILCDVRRTTTLLDCSVLEIMFQSASMII